MKLPIPITPESTSPLREGLVFASMTIALTWLFWIPGAFLPMGSLISDLFLAIGMLAPLAVAIFLEFWLQKTTLEPLAWIRSLNVRGIVVALLLPLMILAPLLLLRQDQGTLAVGKFISDTRSLWLSFVGLLALGIAEEVGWRGYMLPRLQQLPLLVINLIIGVAWFFWQLPLILAGRYNESENFGSFLFTAFLFALLITPFLNRLAMRVDFNPILSGIGRAGILFLFAVYFRQGRADPLTDLYGNLMIVWLVILNAILYSQLWQGRKPPAEISELERVMPA